MSVSSSSSPAGGTAAAVTLMREPAPDVSGVGCVVDAKTTAFLGATTKDPLEACRQELRERYHRDLAADAVVYRAPGEQLAVGPRSSMPADATIVDHAPVADSRTKELQDALSDRTHGVDLNGPCRTEAQTRAVVAATRSRLGIDTFPVTTTVDDDTTPAGAAAGTCVTAVVDDSAGRIVLIRRDRAKLDAQRESPMSKAVTADLRRAAEDAAAKGGRSADGVVRTIEAAAAAHHLTRGDAYSIDVSPTRVGDRVRVYETSTLHFVIYAPGAR